MKPNAVVGIHIDATCVRSAVFAGSRLVLHKEYPRPEGVDFASPGFTFFLRGILNEACANHRRVDIWAAAFIHDTRLYHVRIPVVPASRIVSAVRWAVSKEEPFDEKTVLLDMDIEGEVVEEGVARIGVTAYTMSRESARAMQHVFRSIGYPLTGITLPLFALRNLFRARWVAPSNESALHMHVGLNYSRMSLFSQGNVVLARGIKTGYNALLDAVCNGAETAISPARARSLLNALDGEQAASKPGDPTAPNHGGDVMQTVQPVLVRLVRQVEQTMASQIARKKTGEKTTLYISGEICRHRRIVEFMRENVGMGIRIVNPLKPDEGTADESDVEAVMFAPAIGLALSDSSRTPNALLTREERLQIKKSDNFVRIALVATIVLAVGMAGAAYVMNRMSAKKEAEISKLRSELALTGPLLDTKTLSGMTAKATLQRARMDKTARRTAVVAVLCELSRLTPPQIQLTGMEIEMEPPEMEGTATPSATKTGRANTLVVRGRVRGGQNSPDSVVAAYAVELEKSPVFNEVAVQGRDAKADAREGLQFIMKVVLEKLGQ